MSLSKEFRFFVYLLESYAAYKGTTAAAVLESLDEKGLTGLIFSMYELYHTESIENAFADIDSYIERGVPAW